MIRFGLNFKKVQNYAFFCPESRLHLTLSNPVGTTDRITVNILRGLKSKAIIDLDGVVNLETGELISVGGKEKPTAKKQEPITTDAPVADTPAPTEATDVTAEKPATKKTAKKTAETEEGK